MILYTNGCSHVAAGEAVNYHCFANDDSQYFYMNRRPHPDNLKVSFSQILANLLRARLICDAESAASNDRILRTTDMFFDGQYYKQVGEEVFVLIGWTTFEREEWLHEGEYYQVNSSGVDQVPDALKQYYKEWVVSTATEWQAHQEKWHEKIWQLHLKFKEQNIKHLFFNSYMSFNLIKDRQDWGDNFIAPYDEESTYYNILKAKGFQTRDGRDNGHYMADGHQAYAHYLLPYLTKALS